MDNLPKFLCGGIAAGEWPGMNRKKFAEALYLSKCNNIVLEAMAPAYDKSEDGYNDKNLDQIYTELVNFIKPILEFDELWVTLHLTNGNDETITRFGAQNICDKVVGRLIREVGTNRIILCPIAENSNEPNEKVLVDYCIREWVGNGGHLIFNGTGKPGYVPPGYSMIDYHTQNPADVGPSIYSMASAVLIDTDNGPIINWVRDGAPAGKYWNPDRVRDLATRCKNRGSGLNLYAVHTYETEKYALDIMGAIYDVRKKPTWIERLIMKYKLSRY